MFGQLIGYIMMFAMICILIKCFPSTIKMHYSAYKDGAFNEKYWDMEELKYDQ